MNAVKLCWPVAGLVEQPPNADTTASMETMAAVRRKAGMVRIIGIADGPGPGAGVVRISPTG